MKCPLCETELHYKLDTHYFQCQECKGIVMDEHQFMSEEEERYHYLQHNNDVDDPRYQKFVTPITDYVLTNFNPEDEGLDFGSGTGPVISKVLDDQGYKVRQYDPFFENRPELLLNKYDYILACEVVEHFQNPFVEFQRLKEMLKPKGELVIMTKLYTEDIFFPTWRYKKDQTHVFIFTEETIAYVAKLLGFSSYLVDDRLSVLRIG